MASFRISIFLKAFLFGTLWSLAACAGGTEGSGGGNVFVCAPTKQKLNQGIKEWVLLADGFDFIDAKRLNYSSFHYLDEGSAFNVLVDAANFVGKKAHRPGLGDQIKKTFQELQFSPTEENLPLLLDSVPLEKESCHREQLAIQDLATGVVKYNLRLYRELSPFDRAFFFVHEADIRHHHQQGDTAAVRTEVGELLNSEYFYDYIWMLTAGDRRYIDLSTQDELLKEQALSRALLQALKSLWKSEGIQVELLNPDADLTWELFCKIDFQIIAPRNSKQALMFATLLQKYAQENRISNVRFSYEFAVNHKKWKTLDDFFVNLNQEVTHTSWSAPGLP